ncbi:serine/threonine-protein kinase [Streptosporangium fragile]|uniref:serine/threonine-protein kinase n=1 Tax=Streptosporangium fragile TaxID=46186 RepID=UPI0031E9A36A
MLSQLGRGGMGTVYLGESPDGQRVAIKVINPEYSQHEQFRMRFRREADAAQRVRRFCTAAVVEAALDGDQLYVVTEYVAGPNLEEAVRSGGPLRGSSLDALAVGVATALTAIHGAGVVHRDLKPSNVLLSPVGPRVIDFGIARALDSLSGITGTGELIGTPRYMAPEVLRGEPVSPACDVFSWGCLVAFAASGRAPFGGEALPAVVYQVLNTDPPLDGLEPALRELVAYALDKDPRNRPTSQQLLDHLVGRSAAPEQAAHSVQATWQQGTPAPGEPTPWPGSGPTGSHTAHQGPAAPHQSPAPYTAAHRSPAAPYAPQTPYPPEGHTVTGPPHGAAGHTTAAHPHGTADHTTAAHPHGAAGQTLAGPPHTTAGQTLAAPYHAAPGHPDAPPHTGSGPTIPGVPQDGPGRRAARRRRNATGATAGQRKLVIGAAVAALVTVGGGLGLYLALSPSGPPESLPLIYQDDFTQSGTGWSGGSYDPTGTGSRYGYASEGYYAVDVNGDYPVQRGDAPIPFVPAPPATPDPSASPTPVTPARLLVGADIAVRSGSTGQGEYGLFCRGEDGYKATRYEFLLDTSGNARIRKTVKDAGGELTKPVKVDLAETGTTTRLQAECTPAEDGVRLTMWVDGEEVQSYLDTTPLPNGQVGVIARVGENGKAVLKTSFDNFTLHGAAAPNPS